MISGHPSSEHKGDSKQEAKPVRIDTNPQGLPFCGIWITKNQQIIASRSAGHGTNDKDIMYFDSKLGHGLDVHTLHEPDMTGETYLKTTFTSLIKTEFKDEIDWKAMGTNAAVKEFIQTAARNKTFFYQDVIKDYQHWPIQDFFYDPSRGCVLDRDHCLLIQSKQVMEFKKESKQLIKTPQEDGRSYLSSAELIQMGEELFLIQRFNGGDKEIHLLKWDGKKRTFEPDQAVKLIEDVFVNEKPGTNCWQPILVFSASPHEIVFICETPFSRQDDNIRIVKYDIKKKEVTGVLDYRCNKHLAKFNRVLAQSDGIFLLASEFLCSRTSDEKLNKLYLLDTGRMSLHEIPLERDFFPVGILADQRLVIGSPYSIQIFQNPRLIENYQKLDGSQLLSDKIDEALGSELIPGIRSIIKSYTDGYTLAQSPCRFQFVKQEQDSRTMFWRRYKENEKARDRGDAKSPSP